MSFYTGSKRQNRRSFPLNCLLQQLKKTKASQLSTELSFTTVQKDKSIPAFYRTVFYTCPKRQKRPSFPANCPLHLPKKTKASQLSSELSFTTAQKDKIVPVFPRTVLYNSSKRQNRRSFPLNCLLHRLKKTKASQLSSELSFTTAQKDKSIPAFQRTVLYTGPKRQKR
ncbi:hypothetical protein [Heyndrickxia coagulans]|uniref:hypothetical protein n=1 Tax=Heyndrickxia coagulans TaxID=1398 RepID=UPI001459F8E4|nr:hypothetical protein [Heyndrickxia coagulans]NMH84545.1 hypothetical protein [Heyndrickxia coagulans]